MKPFQLFLKILKYESVLHSKDCLLTQLFKVHLKAISKDDV